MEVTMVKVKLLQRSARGCWQFPLRLDLPHCPLRQQLAVLVADLPPKMKWSRLDPPHRTYDPPYLGRDPAMAEGGVSEAVQLVKMVRSFIISSW